jgi:hypothetical protein
MIAGVRALVKFLRDYHNQVDNGSLPEEVVPHSLPRPLRKVYLNFGKWTKPWSPLAAQNHLLPVDELIEGDGYLCFLRENQNCWTCWCRPGEDIVYCDSFETGRGCENAVQIHESIEKFLITHCLHEAVLSSPELVYLPDFKPPVEVVPLAWKELYMAGRFVYPSSPLDFWFAPRPGLLAMQTPLKDLWLASYQPDLLGMLSEGVEAMQISPRPSGPITYVGNAREPKKLEPGKTKKRKARKPPDDTPHGHPS